LILQFQGKATIEQVIEHQTDISTAKRGICSLCLVFWSAEAH